MTTTLSILYGFGELLVVIVLLSILRSGKAKPEPKQPLEDSHDEPFEQDADFTDDDPRLSVIERMDRRVGWSKQIH